MWFLNKLIIIVSILEEVSFYSYVYIQNENRVLTFRIAYWEIYLQFSGVVTDASHFELRDIFVHLCLFLKKSKHLLEDTSSTPIHPETLSF